jgi:fructokinase
LAIFGEVLLDVFPDRHVVGGAPFNVAWHLHAFGLPLCFFSALGRDALGQVIQEKMQSVDFPKNNLHVSELATGQVLVHPDAHGGHTFEILAPAAFDAIPAPTLAAPLAYYGSLVQRSENSRQALLSWLPKVQKRFFDLNLRAPWDDLKNFSGSLHLADIVKCNNEEWQRLQVAFLPEIFSYASPLLKMQDFESKENIAVLSSYFGWEGVLITQGTDGATFYEAASGCWWQANAMPLPRKFQDSVGAGDAVSAVWLLGEIFHWDYALRLQRGQALAAAICCERGAIVENLAFYQAFQRDWQLPLLTAADYLADDKKEAGDNDVRK